MMVVIFEIAIIYNSTDIDLIRHGSMGHLKYIFSSSLYEYWPMRPW